MKTLVIFFGKYRNYVLVVLFALIALFPLFHEGLIPTHDGEYHVVRFAQFYKVLNEGTLYPRWAPDFNNGYGIPLFNYQYPLPNYISSLFHIFGISFIDSFKLNLIFATIFSAVFMYLWSKSYWGTLGGIVSSIFYTFAPYRFVDIYVRGSVGEVWALAFAPAVLWCLRDYSVTKKRNNVILGGIFLALLIYSHNILALLFFTFIGFYMFYLFLINEDKKRIIRGFIIIILLGLGISAPFFLPALFETKYVTGLQVFDITKNFPEVYELIFPSWGSGFSDSLSSNPLSYQIGVINLAVIALIITRLIRSFIKKGKIKSITIFTLLAFFISVFLMLPYSAIVWKAAPLLSYFQFPWRILSLTILLISFLAGSLFEKISKKTMILSAVLIIVLVLSTISYTKPAYYLVRSDSYYLTRSNFIDGTNSPGNAFNTKWFSSIPPKKPLVRIIKGNTVVKVLINKSTKKSFKFISKDGSAILFSIAYFPGWKAKLNGKSLQIQNSNGIIMVNVPKGKNKVELIFSDTPIRTVASVVFFLSLLVLPFLIIVLV